MTNEQQYKKNQKLAKFLKRAAPFVFWICIGLAVLFITIALINSFGNVGEIIDKLNSKAYTGEQLRNNYEELVKKYGEWTIGNGGAGFTITFVDIKNALFSGVMLISLFLSIIFFASAFLFGKWMLPKLSSQILQDNQDMVNMVVLRNADENACKKE